MRKINYILTLFICVYFSSCSNEGSTSKGNDKGEDIVKVETSTFDTTKLRPFSLNGQELDVTIYVPNDTYKDEEDIERYTPPIIIHNDGEARWEIKIPSDPKWHLVIEEMGDEEVSIEKEKNRQANTIFDYKYIEEGGNYMLFTENINADKSTLEKEEGAISADYHFYCTRKINDYNLVFKSNEMSDFYKPTIKEMLASAIYSK